MIDKFEAINSTMIEMDINDLSKMMLSFEDSSSEKLSTLNLIKFLKEKRKEIINELVIEEEFTSEVAMAITDIIHVLDIPQNEKEQLKRMRRKYYTLYEKIDH